MGADPSAYAALGLEPGAGPAAIDEAYKRLIKQHHPDRAGGDAVRAAEINRAYRELRGERGFKDPLIFNDVPESRRARRGWVAAALVGIACVGLLLIMTGPLAPTLRGGWPATGPRLQLGHVAAAAALADPMDQPLHLSAIDRAMRDAAHIARAKDEMALASASRDCQRGFRDNPSVAQLDRCAAFDDAAVVIENRDPLRDEGPFAELAVTGRQWSAASSLSNDYLAVDSRLDRIRLRVELAFAQAADAAQNAAENEAQPSRSAAAENAAAENGD